MMLFLIYCVCRVCRCETCVRSVADAGERMMERDESTKVPYYVARSPCAEVQVTAPVQSLLAAAAAEAAWQQQKWITRLSNPRRCALIYNNALVLVHIVFHMSSKTSTDLHFLPPLRGSHQHHAPLPPEQHASEQETALRWRRLPYSACRGANITPQPSGPKSVSVTKGTRDPSTTGPSNYRDYLGLPRSGSLANPLIATRLLFLCLGQISPSSNSQAT
jgi:hypothetical protein